MTKIDKIMLITKIMSAVFLFTAMVTGYALAAGAVETVVLANSDCIKCHSREPVTIKDKGGLHKTDVTCLDCHEEHPPQGTEAIPPCSNCHEGKSHYDLPKCLSCHSDPHAPLELALADDLIGPCLTCHEQQGKEFKDHPSKHGDESCTSCHTVHKEIPDCSVCHEPHAPGQTGQDCLGCHPVHHPLVIEYPLSTSRAFCTPCHKEIGNLMSQTTTKHQDFTCAFCHRGKHPMLPTCTACHGAPHSKTTHEKMPDCLECHLDNHNLAK